MGCGLIGWLVGWLVGRLVGWSVGRLAVVVCVVVCFVVTHVNFDSVVLSDLDLSGRLFGLTRVEVLLL